MEARLDDVVEVVAVIVWLICEDMDTDRHGVVDGGVDGQGIFNDAQPVHDGLFGPHAAEISFGSLIRGVDLEVVREELKVGRRGGIIPASPCPTEWLRRSLPAFSGIDCLRFDASRAVVDKSISPQ